MENTWNTKLNSKNTFGISSLSILSTPGAVHRDAPASQQRFRPTNATAALPTAKQAFICDLQDLLLVSWSHLLQL